MAEQHINTFENGMTSDVSVIYQPNGTYRYMKNCQLISQDGNNFVIKDCMGNVKLFTINTPYSGTTATLGTTPCPIGFISFPDQLYVFSTNNATELGGYGEIGVFDYQPYGEGYRPEAFSRNDGKEGYKVLYHSTGLKFTQLRQIEGFAFEENASLRRIYWTDNFNQPRVLNTSDPIFDTYYSGAADLTVGERYMVLQGAVEYDGVDYGPGLTDGNIFTCTTGGTTSFTDITGPSPTALVIKYYPVELLDFTPARKLGSIRFDSYGSGSVYCGSKIYFYRLTKAAEGITTSWSYGSAPIHVGTMNTIPGPGSAGVYFDFAGGGQSALTNSTYSVNVTISDIDVNFDLIELACAEFDETLNVPRQITIVNSSTITGEEMTIEHNGQLNLGTLTTNDVTLFPTSIITAKTMTTNKNYILVGNITERQEYDFDKTVVPVSAYQTDYYMPVSDSSQGCTTGLFDFNWIGPNPNGNPVAGEILFGTKWIVSDAPDAGNRVEYPVASGTYYYTGDIFVGIAGSQAATFTGTAQARPCVSYNRYTPINGSSDRQNYIRLKEAYNGAAYWNYKHPAVASHIKGYWNGEKYRFGILFYDKQGNPFYVRHLIDYTFDPQDTAGISYLDTSGTVDVVGLKVHGAVFDGIRLEKELVDNISGFSIVRAERDKRILQQCAMWQVGADATVPSAINYYPVATYLQNSTRYNTNSLNRYCLICPDHNSSFPETEATSANFPYFELASWFEVDTLMSNYKAKDQNNQFETQLFLESLGDSNAGQVKKIVYVEDVNEAELITGAFNEPGAEFYNNCYIGAALSVNTSCVGASPTDLGGAVARGGKKIIIKTDSTFNYFNTANDYSNLAVAGNAKANVNIVLDKDVFYGGDSEIALANTIYIQCGHYQPITDEVIADNNNTNDPAAYSYLTFNDVEVYGGDAYTCLVDYGYGLFDDSGAITPPSAPATSDYYSYAIKFPCQLNANYDLRSGRTTAKNRMHATATGVAYSDAAEVRLEEFFYNEAYSSEGTPFAYAAKPLNYLFNDKFRTRIRYAGPKINGESPNSFRNFAAIDLLDLDGQGGEINNLRTKNARTVVWQNAMVSTVPIGERQVVSGLDGAETTIGTGGVVDRFDPITSYFGNQHQWGLTQTEFGYVWFDMRRKAFVALDFASGVEEISQIKGLKGFFDEVFLENSQYDQNYTEYINSPNYDIYSDRPLTGFGITGVYDPKFKMTYLTFKFQQRDTESGPTVVRSIAKDFTIGYYHPTKMFIGFYDWTPGISWNHNQLVLSVNNPKNPTKYYGANMPSTNFVIGDIIGDGTKTYICYAAGTVAAYVSPPSAFIFTEITDTDELWIHNQPVNDGTYTSDAGDYQYNKFFGYVVDNECTIVINPKTQNPFSVINIEQEGNNVNFTDLYLEAGSQTASETSITATNRWYRVIWDKICSSLPSSSTGRITNSYLQLRWVKKNWTTDRRTLTGSVKVLRYIKSFFVQKR